MQYALPSTREGVGLVPIYIFGINASVLPISFFLSIGLLMTFGQNGDAKSLKKTIYTQTFVCTLISPVVGLACLIVIVLEGDAIRQAMTNGGTDIFDITEFTTLLITAMTINPTFYFTCAVLIDFWQNRVWSQNIKGFSNIMEGQDGLTNADSIQKENLRAMNPDAKLPIQAYKCSKVFSNKTGSFYAIKEASLVLHSGETVGLLGPNGAGKSTMFNLLSTYHSLSEGTIRTFGQNLSNFSSFFKKTGICTQDNVVWGSLSVERHMMIMRILYGIPNHVVQSWMQLLELEHAKNRVPNQLSSGMNRKLCFMFSACSNPLYKFMDEPTTGLDPMARKRFREIIDHQKALYGSSSILTTHTMNEAEKSCDRIVIIVNGNIVLVESVEDLKQMVSGFTLTVVKNNNQQIGVQMLQTFKTAFPEVEDEKWLIIEENESKVTFDLFGLEKLSEKFEKMQMFQD